MHVFDGKNDFFSITYFSVLPAGCSVRLNFAFLLFSVYSGKKEEARSETETPKASGNHGRNACIAFCNGRAPADQRGPWGLGPPCPQDVFKIMQFSGNFKGKPPMLSKFCAQSPLGSKNSAGPPLTILDPLVVRVLDLVWEVHTQNE